MEPGPPYDDGPHLYENSMKFRVMDVLLKKLIEKGAKILIFSQMTRLLDILDDYLRFKQIPYCRIDGQTSAMDRETRIEDFQSEGSDKLVFLLSTRAGGLGIDLFAANTVIIFDSDWNPQVDLQAIDRAHRIGQKREVTIYRFVTEGSIEDVIVRRAARKLKIDHMIMQKGKFGHGNSKKLTTQDMMNAIHCGAQEIIMSKDEQMTEQDIDKILQYGTEKTDEINKELNKIEQKFNLDNISLTGNENDGHNMYYFEGEDYKNKQKIDGEVNFIETSRDRKHKAGGYDIDKYYREAFNVPVKDKKRLRGWRAIANGGYDHQFFNIERLDELDNILLKYQEYQETPDEFEKPPPEFTDKDESEKQKLLNDGFSNWSKKDFFHYLKCCEKYGRNDYDMILAEMANKTRDELDQYSKYFWDNCAEIK
jgi:SWI/SNF-related matrix-associated actin-dependent regulator of chromatin subfamily A member 5